MHKYFIELQNGESFSVKARDIKHAADMAINTMLHLTSKPIEVKDIKHIRQFED